MIEAVVALVVIGVAAIPITVLISQSINQLGKVAEANSRAAAVTSALAVVAPINPLETPSGAIELGSLSIAWRSTVLVPPNENIQIGSGLGGYKVGFYDVEIDLLRQDTPWFSFSLRKVGYERRQIEGLFESGN